MKNLFRREKNRGPSIEERPSTALERQRPNQNEVDTTTKRQANDITTSESAPPVGRKSRKHEVDGIDLKAWIPSLKDGDKLVINGIDIVVGIGSIEGNVKIKLHGINIKVVFDERYYDYTDLKMHGIDCQYAPIQAYLQTHNTPKSWPSNARSIEK